MSSAVCTSRARNGSVWNVPPTKVAVPVIRPRTRELPRPVSWPSSERPSESPMLMAAPKAAARPTSSAAREPAMYADANTGASVEIVPSISPTSPGCTTCRSRERSSDRRQRARSVCAYSVIPLRL